MYLILPMSGFGISGRERGGERDRDIYIERE